MLKLLSTVLTLLASACLTTAAMAQGFFAGKTLTILVNYDADYIADSRKTMGESPEYVSSPDLNELVQKGLSISPQMQTFMQDYGKGGR